MFISERGVTHAIAAELKCPRIHATFHTFHLRWFSGSTTHVGVRKGNHLVMREGTHLVVTKNAPLNKRKSLPRSERRNPPRNDKENIS